MTINELRVGNLIISPFNDVIKVKGITAFLEVEYSIGDEAVFREDPIIKFNPIPIIDEWLLKFGGKKDTYENSFIYTDEKTELRLYCNEGWVQLCKGLSSAIARYKHVKYVHQLQNLYFALTGKELQYNGKV